MILFYEIVWKPKWMKDRLLMSLGPRRESELCNGVTVRRVRGEHTTFKKAKLKLSVFSDLFGVAQKQCCSHPELETLHPAVILNLAFTQKKKKKSFNAFPFTFMLSVLEKTSILIS